MPECVEIGHNGIRSAYKRKGCGYFQMKKIDEVNYKKD